MTQKDKVLNCSNCRIGDFKRSLCDCHNGFCAKYKGIGTEKDFFMAIEALSEPSGDLISRVDAIEALGEEPEIILDTDTEWEMHDRWVDAMTSMKSLPSAEAVQGEWNKLSHDTFHCNLCGHTFIVMQGCDAMNYCPSCGARMSREDGEFK